MNYGILYSPDAEDQLAALPAVLQNAVLSNLERLAEDPMSADVYGLWPVRQLFQFKVDDGNQLFLFNVVWRYHEDEINLRGLVIAYAEIPRPLDDS